MPDETEAARCHRIANALQLRAEEFLQAGRPERSQELDDQAWRWRELATDLHLQKQG